MIPFIVALALATSGGSANWSTDFAEVQAQAKASGKPILANFTGSDWCPYCQDLQTEVFQTAEFKTWAAKNVILFEADFPQKKKLSDSLTKQNESLAKKYGIRSFPTVLFLNAKGEILAESGYQRGGPKLWTRDAQKRVSAGIEAIRTAGPWPAIVPKNMPAQADLRGKKMPTREVGTLILGTKPKFDKVTVIDLWATWCGPCIELMPEVDRWAKKYKGQIDFIGVSNEEADVVKAFFKEKKVSYAISSDPDQKIQEAFGVGGIPFVIVVSPDGIVRWQGIPVDPRDPLTEAVLDKIVAASKLKS